MKGLIITAGYGTRFLPVTKTIPKEMLPLIDKPSIAFIIEEFIASGINEIIMVTSRRKKSLEDYFDREIELESIFKNEGNLSKLEKIKPYDAEIVYIRQKEMLGTGHAILSAKSLLRNEPFVTAYPDDLHFGEVPLAKQLIQAYEESGCTVLATLHDPPAINRYGVLTLDKDNYHALDIVEKPPLDKLPSKEASIGRFLSTPDFLEHLEEGWKKHKGGEYFHVYGLKKLMEKRRVVYKQVEGLRLDIGTPEGYIEAIIEYALNHPEYSDILKKLAQKKL